MTNFGYQVLGFGSFPNRAIFATASSASTFNVQPAFGTADYQSGTPKILIIPSGVDLGPMTIPSGMGGTLQIENAGTILGLGGTAGSAGSANGGNGGNGGAGGHAITSAHSFDLINTGTISGGGGGGAGGGGGGQGGSGGNGSYTSMEVGLATKVLICNFHITGAIKAIPHISYIGQILKYIITIHQELLLGQEIIK